MHRNKNNGNKQAIIDGAATTIVSSNLTASRAVVSDSNGKVSVSDVTATELGYHLTGSDEFGITGKFIEL